MEKIRFTHFILNPCSCFLWRCVAWMLPFSSSRNWHEGCCELDHQRDKLVSPPGKQLAIPLVVPASVHARAGTSGDTPQTRTGRGAREAGLFQRLPGAESEDVPLQTTAVTAHERAALHHAAQVWLPHEKHRWVHDAVQLLLSLQMCLINIKNEKF